MKKKILLIGKEGQVGFELQKTLQPLGEVYGCSRAECDLMRPDQIIQVVRHIQPHIIVNAAAYTAVDKAESEPEVAFAINSKGVELLAEEAKRLGALLIHYSTDYVFNGSHTTPYKEEDDPSPLNVYGCSKWEGERAIHAVSPPHLILRTSWVYGMRGKNFLLTMLKLGLEREQLFIVGDQIGAPTNSYFLAESTANIISHGFKKGFLFDLRDTYHLSSRGEVSWFGFAESIFSIAYGKGHINKIPHLREITSDAYKTAALRPKYSVLSHQKITKTFPLEIPFWKDSLHEQFCPL